jgi:hypothetical protein
MFLMACPPGAGAAQAAMDQPPFCASSNLHPRTVEDWTRPACVPTIGVIALYDEKHPVLGAPRRAHQAHEVVAHLPALQPRGSHEYGESACQGGEGHADARQYRYRDLRGTPSAKVGHAEQLCGDQTGTKIRHAVQSVKREGGNCVPERPGE